MNLTDAARYSALDRTLHRLAFSNIEAQKALSDIEDRIYAGRVAGVEIDRPVFITSLPRAGTTLMLEMVHSVGGFASHTYRDMPFLLIPLLWNTLSGRFQASGEAIPRAHGDGMTVAYDSVEAFEEVIWRAFWPQKYASDRIFTWSAEDSDSHGEFDDFLKNHVRKLLALRSGGETSRYISKNNANLSRIPKLLHMFPNATVLVPFRNPVDHVGSMLRQHLNFNAIHAENEFARRYMRDIGHFDFGANLAPIDFGRWMDDAASCDPPEKAGMWLKYWIAAFEHVLSESAGAKDGVVLVSYDECCANPAKQLDMLADAVGLDERQRRGLAGQAAGLRPSTAYDADALGLDRAALADALAIHDELLSQVSRQR